MMSVEDHLENYRNLNQIPNIIFHGPYGGGKRALVERFLRKIYPSGNFEDYVIRVNCAFEKGIKFIRENIKHFAKTNVHGVFKSIVLLNADQLTCDAQSALRRCIEQFSFNTRFFIITTDKHKLLKPILSRFSEIYVPPKHIPHNPPPPEFRKHIKQLKLKDTSNLQLLSHALYEDGFSALDLAKHVELSELDSEHKYGWLIFFAKIKSEIRNEEMLLYAMLYFYVFPPEDTFFLFL
jgi:DNA polymerase III delta prime subunit